MIVKAKKFSGICDCGREHNVYTELFIIESGCLKRIDEYIKKYGFESTVVAVYDQNTYIATAGRHPKVDLEVVLPFENLHADEHGVKLLSEKLPEKVKTLIAIGAGTVHDITRYCAYERGIDFISCPTAASVDGFCSSVAAMTWNGCKKTLTAVAPKIVIADLDVIKNAPIRLARSGFGDMAGKYVALTDWKIANIINNEYYCSKIASITFEATKAVLKSASGIIKGETEAFEKLMYGLLLSGVAMQLSGNSRPASGSEHHISHLKEMQPEDLKLHSDALHGEKVGVGTLLVIDEYNKLCDGVLDFCDYSTYKKEEIYKVFGKAMGEEILNENQNDSACNIRGETIKDKWNEIITEIRKIPNPDVLRRIYSDIGVKSTLADIKVDNNMLNSLINYSPMVRNRLTMMRLRKCIIKK